ncbi:MAG TPA: TauD/TfdA family dioxygenase [Steroidobacteraceae bacterium]|nr:TauD/TfdA family dioxygenase [Steroidobacteraceae bacterium]
MTLTVNALGDDFVAEVHGVDFARPVAPATIVAITDVLNRYGVAVFRETGLDDQRHVAFSRQFGELELAPQLFGAQRARFAHPELFDAGNVDRNGQILLDERRRLYNKGNALWHTDSSFNPRRAAYSLLLAHRVPPVGGDTQFANMRAAYAQLPPATQSAIEDLIVEHWLWHSRLLAGYPPPTAQEREAKPPSRHKLVQYHPGAGAKTLYLAAHASHIIGWPQAQGRDLLRELMEFATQPRFTCAVRWKQPGDMVIWDNRSTMHRATAFEDTRYPRDMRRTTVYDSGR